MCSDRIGPQFCPACEARDAKGALKVANDRIRFLETELKRMRVRSVNDGLKVNANENRIRELEAEVERLRGRCERFCTICKGHYFHRDPLCPWCEVERLRNEWVPDAAYATVYDDREQAVRLLRELRDGCKNVLGDDAWPHPNAAIQINFEAALDAAEKYLEGKAGAS
jgi:hypothetical protein